MMDLRKPFDLLKLTERAETIAIAGHVRPDGDAVGSTLGLYNYLKKICPEKKITLILEQPPAVFRNLKGFEEIVSPSDAAGSHEVYDLFFAVDLGADDRLGEAAKCFREAGDTACIDHHISNTGFSRHDYVVPEASSASELVYTLLREEEIDRDIAECLYTGIIHDTGVLQYSCTSRKTLEIVGKLIEYGFDFSEIIEHTFYEKTWIQNQILGRALVESILFLDGKCAAAVMDYRAIDFYRAAPGDFEGIVNQILHTKGVECAVFMSESTEVQHQFKVSLRSKNLVDVSRIAMKFGGGGHRKAAGFTMSGTRYDVLNCISEEVEKQLRDGIPGSPLSVPDRFGSGERIS